MKYINCCFSDLFCSVFRPDKSETISGELTQLIVAGSSVSMAAEDKSKRKAALDKQDSSTVSMR